jgi:hypothetical protein
MRFDVRTVSSAKANFAESNEIGRLAMGCSPMQ